MKYYLYMYKVIDSAQFHLHLYWVPLGARFTELTWLYQADIILTYTLQPKQLPYALNILVFCIF